MTWSVITEIHVAHTKTKMYFMHGVGTYERNSNDKSHLYGHIFVTDREIFKGKLPARVICTVPVVL